MTKILDLLNVTEINEKDTVASAFVKGSTNAQVKIALIGGLVHLGIKGFGHFRNRGTSNKEEA
mgnify:CR=1 FL=1